MTRPLALLLSLAAALTLASACGVEPIDAVADTNNDANNTNNANNANNGTNNNTVSNNGDESCRYPDPREDSDHDGIRDILEDRNRDCVVDPGETDPHAADSDGDGLTDGQEDIDGDGFWDQSSGELDPTRADTDGDGIPDNLNPIALVCTRDLQAVITPQRDLAADVALALPTNFTFHTVTGADGAVFGNPEQNVFGFVAVFRQRAEDVSTEADRVLTDIGARGLSAIPINRRLFQTWDEGSAAAQRTRILFDASQRPTALRRDLLAAVAGVDPDALGGLPQDTDRAADTFDFHMLVQYRQDQDRAVVVGVLTDTANLQTRQELQLLFSDLTGGTTLAPANRDPKDFQCESRTVERGPSPVDFIWVVDNSRSMGDEQLALSRAADTFSDGLASSGVDYRLGVTVTDTHLNGPPGHLLGDGFTRDIDAFKRDVLAGTDGSGDERGLLGGLLAIEAAANATDDARRLRPDAQLIVVFASDEEDTHLNQGGTPDDDPTTAGSTRQPPLHPDSDVRARRTQSFLDGYNQASAIAFAIVGDPGPDHGGVCAPLDPGGTSVDGASYGLGYIDLALGTGGSWGSICNDDLAPTISPILEAAVGVASDYHLPTSPISPTLRVAINGELVPRSRANGWDYEPASNAIVFHGSAVPAVGDVLAIAYLEWELTIQ